MPKFYLQGFAAGARLEAINVRTGKEHTTNVADATVESNFYTVPDHPIDPASFEAELSVAEGLAAGVFRSIIEGVWPLEPSDRKLFAEFMTLQFLRVQSHRSQMHHAVAAQLKSLAEDNPVELARILTLPGAPSRFDITKTGSLTRFPGRFLCVDHAAISAAV